MFSVPCIFIHSKSPSSQNACVCVCVCVCVRVCTCLEQSLGTRFCALKILFNQKYQQQYLPTACLQYLVPRETLAKEGLRNTVACSEHCPPLLVQKTLEHHTWSEHKQTQCVTVNATRTRLSPSLVTLRLSQDESRKNWNPAVEVLEPLVVALLQNTKKTFKLRASNNTLLYKNYTCEIPTPGFHVRVVCVCLG